MPRPTHQRPTTKVRGAHNFAALFETGTEEKNIHKRTMLLSGINSTDPGIWPVATSVRPQLVRPPYHAPARQTNHYETKNQQGWRIINRDNTSSKYTRPASARFVLTSHTRIFRSSLPHTLLAYDSNLNPRWPKLLITPLRTTRTITYRQLLLSVPWHLVP